MAILQNKSKNLRHLQNLRNILNIKSPTVIKNFTREQQKSAENNSDTCI